MINSRAYSAILFAALSAFVPTLNGRMMTTPKSRSFEMLNKSGKKLVVEWVNPLTGEMVPLADSANGEHTKFNSFVNHTFAIHESQDTCRAGGEGGCEVRFVTISEQDEQGTVAVVKRDLEVDFVDALTKARDYAKDATENCKKKSQEALKSGYDTLEVMDELAMCLQDEATHLFQKKNDEIAFEAEVRLDISAQLENHTCAEPDKQTSEPIEIRTWIHKDEDTRDVFVLHDRPASQIHVLKNFISEEECQAFQKAAQPKLHRGTVADGKGGHRLSEHRKAFQAGLRVPWENEAGGNPIARVVRRIYDYTNDAVGYNLTIEGQESLMSIQYFGIGKGSNEAPDQYRPHCDGECDGLPHKSGGRVATMVMYCTVPELGGATNFQNSNVFVKPEVGAAAFFSYLDPVKMMKEPGFTSHSGCPVIEGTKRIAVQWMRLGVDNENPWDSFNTLTIKREDEDC